MKPISKTAFYCCGIRMEDAERGRSVCRDTYAKLFMNDEGRRILGAFKDEIRAKASNVTRHRIIDDILRRKLSLDPLLLVVLVGAGFDSRAYRLQGGTWVELDEPQVIVYKNDQLPSSDCPNRLHRIAIDFSAESIEERLAPFACQKRVVIVVEGVLLYLEQAQIRELFRCLRSTFPRHELICDLMNRKFFDRYARKTFEKIACLGATQRTVDRPEEIFRENGYRLTDRISITVKSFQAMERSMDRRPHRAILPFVARLLFPTAVTGYSICEFELE